MIGAEEPIDKTFLDQGEWEMLVGSSENGWIQRLFDGLLGAKH